MTSHAIAEVWKFRESFDSVFEPTAYKRRIHRRYADLRR